MRGGVQMYTPEPIFASSLEYVVAPDSQCEISSNVGAL